MRSPALVVPVCGCGSFYPSSSARLSIGIVDARHPHGQAYVGDVDVRTRSPGPLFQRRNRWRTGDINLMPNSCWALIRPTRSSSPHSHVSRQAFGCRRCRILAQRLRTCQRLDAYAGFSDRGAAPDCRRNDHPPFGGAASSDAGERERFAGLIEASGRRLCRCVSSVAMQERRAAPLPAGFEHGRCPPGCQASTASRQHCTDPNRTLGLLAARALPQIGPRPRRRRCPRDCSCRMSPSSHSVSWA